MTTTPRTRTRKRKLNAGIYCRISKKQDGGDGESLGVQRQTADCKREAERRGWNVVDIYSDDDRSAYSGKPRPEYVRLCDDLKSGRVEAVIVWHVDRLHRSPRELEGFIDLIEATAAAVVAVHGGDYDLATDDGRFRARIMGAVARKESEDKSRRLRRKHVELAEQGAPNGGRRPMGYQRIGERPQRKGDPDTRELVLDKKEAPIVRKIVERVANGETLTRIADDLNARGVPTSAGAPWTISTVRRIALNPLYARVRVHKGVEVAEGTWPEIVDEATWRRAVALLHAPDRPQRRSSRRYLLTGGILECGKCGAPMRSKPHHVRTGPVRTYGCPPKKLGGCGGVNIRADALEQLVVAAVIARVESKAFARALRAQSGGDRKAAGEVNKLTAELKALERAKVSGALSLREYMKFRDATAGQLALAQSRMGGDVKASAVGRFVAQTGALRKWWDAPTTTLDQQQSVVRAVVEKVVVQSVGKGGGRVVDPSRVQVIPTH